MIVDPDEVKVVKRVLWPEEEVDGTIKQRRIGPGGSITVPTTVVVTNMRLIIINRATLGFRQDYQVIPYSGITSVRLEHGIISSSVFIRVQGFSTEKGLMKSGDQEGEIDGLHNRDAEELADYINRKLEKKYDVQAEVTREADIKSQIDSGAGVYVYCNNCGEKNKADAKFCSKCGAALTAA